MTCSAVDLQVRRVSVHVAISKFPAPDVECQAIQDSTWTGTQPQQHLQHVLQLA